MLDPLYSVLQVAPWAIVDVALPEDAVGRRDNLPLVEVSMVDVAEVPRA